MRGPSARPSVRRGRPAWALLGALVLAGLGACSRRPASPLAKASPLFTGHEAQRRVLITFPSGRKPGFINIEERIFATDSQVAQAKQILLDLMAGPKDPAAGAVPCFAPGASFWELFLGADGTAVVDLPEATVDALPGGTSCEVATLYCLVHTLCSNLPQVRRVQVLVDGRPAESLRGHFDLLDPLSPSDF